MIYSLLVSILNTILNFVSSFNSRMNSLELKIDSFENTLQDISINQIAELRLLKEIIQQLTPSPAVALAISFEVTSNSAKENKNKGNNMNSKAALTFELKDDGTGTATVSFIDKAGNSTAPPIGAAPADFTSSDPAVTVTATDPVTGALVATGTLAQGVIITATVVVTDPSGTNAPVTLTGTGAPINVVADVATGIAVMEQ